MYRGLQYKYKIYSGIAKLFLRRRILREGRIARTSEMVNKEYSWSWSRSSDEFLMGNLKTRPQMLRDRFIFCTAADHRKFFFEYLKKTVSSLQPQKALELGSGDGLNILALAVDNPNIKELIGIELTETGVRAANNFLKNPPIRWLTYITGKTEKTIRARISGRNITFLQGDILELPFEKETFAFAFSMWVLEQIPKNYPRVFSETARVLDKNGHALFLEAFQEAQNNIFQKMHLKNIDYFRASFREAEKFGLRVLKFEPIPLTKIKFSNGALLCGVQRE